MALKFAVRIALVIAFMLAISLSAKQEVRLSLSISVTSSLSEQTSPNLFLVEKGGTAIHDTLACVGCSGNGSGYG